MRFKKINNPKTKKNTEMNQTATDILNAAYDLFTTKGYCSVTVRDIASAANVNAALVSYYFNSKENLADLVYQKIANEQFTSLATEDFLKLSAGEKMYVYAATAPQDYDLHPVFILEYMQFCHNFYIPGPITTSLSQEVLYEYKINISPLENEFYLTTFVSTEHALLLRKSLGEFHISYEDIADIMLSNYLYNIGLPDETIAAVISNAKNYLASR